MFRSNTTHIAKRLAQPFSRRNLLRAAHTMAPTLVAPAFASTAHAQGTMDFTGATTLMTTFNDRLAYVAISRASDDARIYTNNAETLGERLASDITKTAALAPPEQGVSGRGAESIRTGLREAAVPVPTLPEIDLEGFGLGL